MSVSLLLHLIWSPVCNTCHWSHKSTMAHFSSASNPFFFKVLLHDFHEKLLIPRKFVREHLAHVNSSKSRATIKSPLQRSWVVYIHVNKEGYFFEDGWRRFVDDHHLNVADLLVFEYEGFLQFSVKLFDNTTCEKEYPPSTRKTSKDCVIGPIFYEPPTTSPSGMPDEECEISPKNHTTGRSPAKDVYQSDGISYFKATISRFNICHSYMCIPAKFSAMNGFRHKREITVGDPEGREWQLKISHRRGRQRNQRFFYGDWLNFARVNGLEVGDVCAFEYNPDGEKDIMYVRILKKQSEPVLEDTKECRTSSKIEDQSPRTCLKRRASCEESEVMLKKQATMSSKEIASPRCFKASIKPSNLTNCYMNIPDVFIKSRGLKKREKLYLRDPIGELWKVEISHKHEPMIHSHFSRGWLQFANGNCLKVGDVCVFEIDPDREDIMNVYIDKMTSGCEKEYPLASQKGGKEHKSGIKVGARLTTSPSGCTKEGASDDKLKSNKWTTENSQLRNDMETDGVYQQDGISFFVATIKPANITYSYVYIPSKFLTLNGLWKKQEIMVRDPRGREWQLKISVCGIEKTSRRFGGVWRNLAGDNGLEVGDVCIFEFNPKGGHSIMDLRIVKKKCELNHCEKDTSPSVQKNSEEQRTEYKIEKQCPSGCTKQGSWFAVSLKAYNIHKSYMYIPVEFAASNGFQNRNKIMLRDPEERLWEMQIFNHFYPGWKESQFGGTWLQFVKANGLEVGDICLFKNISDREEIMDVHIIKYQSDPCPNSIRNCKIEGTPFPSSIGESRLEESADVIEPTKTTNQEKLESDQMKKRTDTSQPSAFEYVPSMANVLALLKDTPGILKNSPEYFHAISKFTNESHRQAFVLLVDPETRALWIKHDYGFTHNM